MFGKVRFLHIYAIWATDNEYKFQFQAALEGGEGKFVVDDSLSGSG